MIDTTGQAVESVIVSVRTYQGVQHDQVRTKTSGVFVLRGIPPGRWYLSATRDGYELHPPSSRELVIEPAVRMVDITLRVAKLGVLAGQVTDELGEPVVGATVRVQSAGPWGAWEGGSLAVTDDRGRYRLWTVRPGLKLISVQPIYANASPAILNSEAATDPQAASVVRQSLVSLGISQADMDPAAVVALGEERVRVTNVPVSTMVRDAERLRAFRLTFHDAGRGLRLKAGEVREDIDLRLTRLPAVHVSGRLTGQPDAVSHVPIQLVYDDLPEGRPYRELTQAARTVTRADGRFMFAAVPAGRYILRVNKAPQAPPRPLPSATVSTGAGTVGVGATTPAPTAERVLPEGDTLWAQVPVTVAASDVTGLTVSLRRAVHVSGRLEFEGSGQRPASARMVRLLMSAWSDTNVFHSGVVDAEGRFRTAGLMPGRYALRLSSLAGSDDLPWYPKSITVAGRDVTNGFIDVSDADVGEVVFTLTDRKSTLDGAVTDQRGAAVSEATVVAFPVEPAARKAGAVSLWRVKRATTDSAGQFTLGALIPGDYFVTATTDDLASDWLHSDVLASLQPTAQRVRVTHGGAIRINLSIPTGQTLATTEGTEYGPAGPYVPDEGLEKSQSRSAGAPPASGSIRGLVTDHGGDQPVVNALVTLTPVSGGGSITTHTDGTGQFLLPAVPGGRYRLHTSKAAHLTTEYGARRFGRPGVPVQVVASTQMDVRLALPRGAVITGRVFDEQGRPVTNAIVRVLVLRQSVAGPQLIAAPGATPAEVSTDDRGEYRAYGLPAGEYFVGAIPPLSLSVGREVTEREVEWARGLEQRHTGPPPIGRTVAHAPAFFPTAHTVGAARPIRVETAEERSGIDIHLRSQPVFTLSGRVVSMGGLPSAGARVMLMPEGLSVPTTRQGSSATPGLAYSVGGPVVVTASAQGLFDIRSLAPGMYRLLVRGSAPGAQAITEWNSVPVAIGSDDVTDMVVALQPASTVTVQLDWPSELPVSSRADVALSLTPADPSAGLVTVANVRPDVDGRATFRGVIPGDYWVGINGLPRQWVALSALSLGRDALDQPMSVASDRGDTLVEVRLSDRSAELSGTFTDAAGRPATDYMVIVFPTERALWPAGGRRIRVVRPATDGRYSVPGLPPGAYRLAAVADAEPDEWLSVEFLEQLMTGSVEIVIREGQVVRQDITQRSPQ